MSTSFLKEDCYKPANGYCACIAFHLDEHHRRAFNASQMIEFSLGPNPDADDDKNEPPQKLSIAFSTADVVVLGWRLDFIADHLGDNKLAGIGILPKRYAELERAKVFVSAITITPIGKA